MTTKEKLEKIKKLADDMYYAAANLGPNVGSGERLRKTMEDYHKFIIHEFNEEEPTIPDIVDEHFDEMLGEDPLSGDLNTEIQRYLRDVHDKDTTVGDVARHFAAWQKEQDKQWLAENHKHIFAKGRESAEAWISADDDVNNAAEKTTRHFCKISLLSGDYLSLAEAQPQVNKESKLIAIKSFVCGAQWDRNKLMKEAKLYGWVARDENGSLHLFEVEPSRIEDRGQWWDRDYDCTTLDKNDFPDLKWEDEPVYVKLIILKED